jgi:hypothetical protein
LFDEMQPQNLSASYPRANQERQRHPQQYYDNDCNGQEGNVKQESAYAAHQQRGAHYQQADHGRGFTK